MSETPKQDPSCQEVEPDETEKGSTWEADQMKHDYYYDDSHGYEKYEPDADEEDYEART